MSFDSREAIAVALFNLLQTMGATFTAYSRRPQYWEKVPNKPALFMGNTKENVRYSGDNTALQINELFFPITIYIDVGLDPNTTPDTTINALLTAVDAVLAPPNYPVVQQTLGGLVAYARRDGELMRIPGYLDGKGVVFFNIKVLVPA